MENQLKITNELENVNGIYYSKQKDIINIKRELYSLQNNKCPLLNKVVDFDKTVIDHKHKTKAQTATLDNQLGFIRGALEFRANAFEGKVYNFYKRLGLDKEISFSELLRNLADYHDESPCKDPILHYTEVPARLKVSISDYKRVCKYYFRLFPKKKVLPKKPTYLNAEWEEYIKSTNDLIHQDKVASAILKQQKQLKREENARNRSKK